MALYALDAARGPATPHQRGEWSAPGVMCVDAINDHVDAKEAGHSTSSPKGD